MVPSGGILTQKTCLVGVICIYDASRKIDVTVATDLVNTFDGLAGYGDFAAAALTLHMGVSMDKNLQLEP